jgi:hypothetical protein
VRQIFVRRLVFTLFFVVVGVKKAPRQDAAAASASAFIED